MAKQILRDVTLLVNGVDLSEYVSQVGVPQSTDVQDVTGMKAKAKEKLLGIPDSQITATMFQDYDASAVDDTLSPLVGSNDGFEVVVIPKLGEVGPSNPARRIKKAVLPNYNGLGGSTGQAASTDVTFENSGADGVERIIDPEDL